jgi:chromosome segregation ATPase
MANKNKNIETLVSDGDAAGTSELELIPTLTQPVRYPFVQSESHEKTREFGSAGIDVIGVAVVKHNTAQSDDAKRIEELQFDLEQSQVRQRGLEKELEVREEITTSINEEVREARKQIIAAAAELESLNNDYLSLKAASDRAESTISELASSAANAEKHLAAREETIRSLERQLDDAGSELSDLRNYVDGRKESWAHQAEALQHRQRKLEQLQDENRELKASPDNDAQDEIRACRQQIAEQAGELAARTLEIDGLRKNNARLEKYANELRIRHQDQADSVRESIAFREQLEARLENANGTISELTARISEEQSALREMAGDMAMLRESSGREASQAQLELQTALARIAELESVNDQLVSDLVDSREFRQALEKHVTDIEARYKDKLLKLRREAAGAKERLARSLRAVDAKDATIASLTEELANDRRKISLTGELESALQKIDGFRTANKGSGSPGRSERVTRQLIGTVDGKELRFPLFRDRLTIGRTAHNDIQLSMRFVSRRHAVIATDGNRARVIDWGSRNGVYVNNKRVTEKILEAGDIITIGLANLRYDERAKR